MEKKQIKEIVSQPFLPSGKVTVKNKRDPTNYIKAAKKNMWIKHVKSEGKKKNLSYKEALKVCKYKKEKVLKFNK
jgi:hypothetical protein